MQGVGFRPFVKVLADTFHLSGIVFNTGSGVVVEIDTADKLEALQFLEALRAEAPAASRIERCEMDVLAVGSPPNCGFRIGPSVDDEGGFTLVSPDLATCAKCLAETEDPGDRRFGYPFTNCTECGPRYSITRSVPYDRANTTMAAFELCCQCAAEYRNPADRRFHAEPIACPVCGPQVSLPLPEAIALLEAGRILAIKGLGGFQLACDALHADAVAELRKRKRRCPKPFAVMMRDAKTVEGICVVNDAERRLLSHSAAPIVLLALREGVLFPDEVAPGLRHIGVMLPATPLHHLLFTGTLDCLVMTSGNISEEPIVIGNGEAAEKLGPLCDALLQHDREIFMRVDDSVARVFEGVPRVLRRARGYAPSAIALHREVREVLATGAELKNTFAFTKGRYAIPSQHIGDLENYETLRFFEETLRNLLGVYRAQPELIVHDLHPDYLSTRWAEERRERKLPVQHHHAHIASCMAEHGLFAPVIGVAMDGTGWGTDGADLGGEFLVCDLHGFQRAAHLRYVALPSGDRAAKEGWRMAAAHLHDAVGVDCKAYASPCWGAASPATWKLVERMIAQPAIRTSSCGRLFDAVAALCGIQMESRYEGEAAMLLEAAARKAPVSDIVYEVPLDQSPAPWIVDTRPMVRQIAEEVAAGREVETIARCFHDSVAHMIDESVCGRLRERTGIGQVCLSGGVFQNFTLLEGALVRLRRSGFEVFTHAQIPPNDGGISLGLAVIGAGVSGTRGVAEGFGIGRR